MSAPTPPRPAGAGDPEWTDIHAALSHRDHGPADASRRRFLAGALAAGGGLGLGVAGLAGGPGPLRALGDWAAGAAPLGLDETVLVVVLMGGGNDALNTVVPLDDPAYRSLRPRLALGESGLARLGSGVPVALHHRLGGLAQRYRDGQVAIVNGVGNPDGDHSHFSSMATWMAGTAGIDRRTGWLGRWLDGIPGAGDGLAGISVGTGVPLHLVGNQSPVTSLAVDSAPMGADRSHDWEAALHDALAAYDDHATGRGALADAWAGAVGASIERAGTLGRLYPEGAEPPDGDVTPQLDLAARLINLDLGVRVIAVSFGSFDTHDNQAYTHRSHLADLDAGIDAFFARLGGSWRNRVALMTFSEFGRGAAENASRGTDHGAGGSLFVVGDRVAGGLYGGVPDCANLTPRGDLPVTVDFRSVYASVLGGWLGSDPAPVLGGDFPGPELFSSGPGPQPPPPPPPPVDPRWAPFAGPAALVEQQYLDFLARPAELAGRDYWIGRLWSGLSIAQCVENFLASVEFGAAVAPAARIWFVATDGALPAHQDLLAAMAVARTGERRSIAADALASAASRDHLGGLSAEAFCDRAHRSSQGRAPSGAWLSARTAALANRTTTRAEIIVELADTDRYQNRSRPQVWVTSTYVGMLRRSPEPGGYAYWVDRVRRGITIRRLIEYFFASAEYHARFR